MTEARQEVSDFTESENQKQPDLKRIETSIVAKMQAAEETFRLNADDVIKDTEDLLCHWTAEKQELIKRFNHEAKQNNDLMTWQQVIKKLEAEIQ